MEIFDYHDGLVELETSRYFVENTRLTEISLLEFRPVSKFIKLRMLSGRAREAAQGKACMCGGGYRLLKGLACSNTRLSG